MSTSSPDFVVVGAGVIGCAIAHRLAAAGASVTVLERANIAAEASGAAAGILAPRVHTTPPSMLPLALASHALFGPLVEELRSETGIDVEHVRSGELHLAYNEFEEEPLHDRVRWLREAGHQVEWLGCKDVLSLEPALDASIRGGLYDADASHVNPPRFTRALAQAAAGRGVRFEIGVEVVGLERSGRRVTAVETATGKVPVGHVVVAAGAWSSFCSQWLGLSVQVYPAKGQILTVSAVPAPIRAIVYGKDVYLLPRVDGTIVVGATVERVGFDKSITADALGWLLTTIPSLCPGLRSATLDRVWAGLRPGSPDELPIIGRAPGWENVTLATGHYRNGILLAPITSELVAKLLVKGEEDELLSALSPARFARA